jgi:hypothetical protein
MKKGLAGSAATYGAFGDSLAGGLYRYRLVLDADSSRLAGQNLA